MKSAQFSMDAEKIHNAKFCLLYSQKGCSFTSENIMIKSIETICSYSDGHKIDFTPNFAVSDCKIKRQNCYAG
jgi:hypothetical protein